MKIDFIRGAGCSGCLFGFGNVEFYGDYIAGKYSGKGNKVRHYILMGQRGHKSLANECPDKRIWLEQWRTPATGGNV